MMDISNCKKCILCSNRKQTVYYEGKLPSDMVIIGEAPGEQEDIEGRPFVGPAGQVLNKLLEACSIDRGNIAITNALKCRPENNTTPRHTETDNCLEYTQSVLEKASPRVIVHLGAVSSDQFHRKEWVEDKLATIESRHCRVKTHILGGRPVPCVTTYHPSYVLRYNDGKKSKERLKIKNMMMETFSLALKLASETPRVSVKYNIGYTIIMDKEDKPDILIPRLATEVKIEEIKENQN